MNGCVFDYHAVVNSTCQQQRSKSNTERIKTSKTNPVKTADLQVFKSESYWIFESVAPAQPVVGDLNNTLPVNPP